jgi:tetratricopeptide (TPR) repeat protein
MLAVQVEALARTQSVLLIYEDVHWLDATTQEALDLLVPRLRDLPVLVIITYRPEYLPRWSDQAHVTLLTLNRMGRRQAAELVSKLTGGKILPLEVLDQILAHTDGVPLFVEELTKSVVESKLLRDAGDRYLLSRSLPTLAIPTTLRDSLIARLDRLAPVREVAQVGACIGREFSYQLLAALVPLKGADLDDALTQLNATGLLFRRGAPPDATYTFKHALVQDAAYDSLLKSRRMQLHAQIAEILERDSGYRGLNEPELIAHHFTQSGVHERAVPYWMRAGERALAQAAFQEATGHLRAALSENGMLPASAERDRRELNIRLMLGAAYLSSLGWAAVQVAEVLTPARELANKVHEYDKLAAILYYLWFHHLMLCEYEHTAAIVEELHSLARARNDSATTVIAGMAQALLYWFTGYPKKAREAADRMVEAYDENLHGHLAQTCMHDPKCLTLIWAGQWLWALGYPDQARQAAEEQLALARRLGHPVNLFAGLSVGTVGLTFLGQTSVARQWLAEAHDMARQLAMTFFADAIVPFWDGCVLVAQGDYAEGYAVQTKGCKGWRETGPLHLIPLAHTARASALINLQRFDEAQSLLEEALQIIDRTGQRSDEAEALRVLGEMHQRKPQPDVGAAEKCFLEALEVARRQEAKGLELRAATALARLRHQQGRTAEARDLLSSIYDWFTEGFDTYDLQAARKLLAQLA